MMKELNVFRYYEPTPTPKSIPVRTQKQNRAFLSTVSLKSLSWLTAAIILLFFPAARSAAPPAGFVVEDVLTGLDQPMALRFFPDGRMLVLQKKGLVRIVRINSSTVDFQVYMNFAATEHTAGINFDQERGLIDLAFDPSFPSSPYIYVFYTPASSPSGRRARIARFTHVENQGGVTSRGSLTSEVILWEDTDGYDSCCHYGGGLDFGPDGKLWLTTGDHFQGSYAASLQKSGGKVIRINKSGTIPSDNPYRDGTGLNVDSIFAYGLRNPFRSRWDIPSGRFFIAEVGGNEQSRAWEDLHIIRYDQGTGRFVDADFGTTSDNGRYDGIDFGWPLCEGLPPYTSFPGCNLGPVARPIFAYPHKGITAAINGGVVYRGTQFPSQYQNAYFYADSTRDFVRYLRFNSNGTVAANPNPLPISEQNPDSVSYPFDLDAFGRIVCLDVGPDGALYYVSFTDSGGAYGQSNPSVLGAVRRYVYEGENLRPQILDFTATPASGPVPLEVDFSFSAEDPQNDAMTYTLQFGDGSSAGPASLSPNQTKTVSHTYTSAGSYAALLEVLDGDKAANDVADVFVGNAPVITGLGSSNSRSGSRTNMFRYGDTIRFFATATDAEDGTLAGARFEWNVAFVRPGNVHPSVGPVTGSKFLDFPIPDQGQGFSGAVFYRCFLKVTDSSGLTASATYDIFPEKSDITFSSNPSGILVQVDGNTARSTPFVLDTLINYDHVVTVSRTQCVDDTTRSFVDWSTGETVPQIVYVVPANDSTLRADFIDGEPCTSAPAPPPLTGLVVQLESDVNTSIQSGNLLAAWLDQSGLGNDLVASGNVRLGVTETPTGMPAITLDGSTGSLERTAALGGMPSGNNDRTLFVVAKYNSAKASGGVAYGKGVKNQAFGLIVRQSTGRLALQGWGFANDLESSAPLIGAGWCTQAALLQNGKATLFKDRQQVAQWTHKYNTVLSKLAIGREISNVGYVGMDVSAVLLYDRALSASERDNVETYLRNKYLGGAPQGNSLPTVTITAPPNNSSFSAGTPVNFSGTAQDPEDGVLTGSIRWTSNVDGPIGTGGSIAATLSTGSHTVTATVTDSGNLTHSASVTVAITSATSGLPTSGLVLRLESDLNVTSASGIVSGWGDQSTSGNSLTASGNARVGLAQTPSGLPAITLDGVSGKLQRTAAISGLPAANANRSIFVVARFNNATAWAGVAYGTGLANQAFGLAVKQQGGVLILQGWGGGNDLVSTASGIGAGWISQAAILQTGSATLYKNGLQVAQWTHTYNTVVSKLAIGQEIANLGYVGMDIACVLIYDRALSSTERQNVEAYLQTKYL